VTTVIRLIQINLHDEQRYVALVTGTHSEFGLDTEPIPKPPVKQPSMKSIRLGDSIDEL